MKNSANTSRPWPTPRFSKNPRAKGCRRSSSFKDFEGIGDAGFGLVAKEDRGSELFERPPWLILLVGMAFGSDLCPPSLKLLVALYRL
ncbi:hypothetical protein AKJ16_DCAP13207 [Drosera capensis]